MTRDLRIITGEVHKAADSEKGYLPDLTPEKCWNEASSELASNLENCEQMTRVIWKNKQVTEYNWIIHWIIYRMDYVLR